MNYHNKVLAYARLMRFHHPIGTLLLLWPCLWALWLSGQGRPDSKIVIVFILGVLIMRALGCVINDLADIDFDVQVTRTRDRPLVTGDLTHTEALTLAIFLSFLAWLLVLQLDIKTFGLAVMALLLVFSYPFFKRVTNWPQVVLGVAFAWSILMAYTAQTGYIPLAGWMLFLATVLWTIAYDTIYAIMDREEDRVLGIKSTALLFGYYERTLIAGFQVGMLGLLVGVGYSLGLGFAFYVSLFLAAILMGYQLYLIRNRCASACWVAFLNNNWVGFVIFLGILLN